MSTMFFDGMEDKFQPTYLGMPTNVTQSTTNNTNDGGGKGGKDNKNKDNKEVVKEVIYENGQVIVNFKKGGTQVAAWVPNETGESISPENVEFYGRTQDLYEYYVKTGKIKEITKLLIAANPNLKYSLPGDPNYMTAFTAAVTGASGYNFQQTNGAPAGSQGKTLSVLDYLKKTAGGGGAGGVDQPNVNITGRKTAWDEYRSAFEQLTGKKASPAAFDDFYKKLNAEERKYASKIVGNTNINESFNFQDFTMRYLLSQVKLTGDLKGGLGQYQNNIQQAIRDSGLQGKVSAEAQAKYIRQMVSGKMQPSDLNDILRKKASILYSAFAQDIKDNPELSVSEILDPYTQRYQGLLEIESKDVDMADVIRMASNPDGTKLSTWDYERALKRDERYSYTQRANNEAINLAQSFAKSFGVNI